MHKMNYSGLRARSTAHRPHGWMRKPAAVLLAGLVMGAVTVSQGAAAATLPGSFRGEAFGTNATAVVGPIAASLGRTAYLPCPCQGTNGAIQQNNVTSLSAGLGGTVLTAGAVTSTVFARKTATNTVEVSNTSTIADINLLNGLITATTIKAVANTNANATQIASNATGSQFVNLVINGNPISANPAPGTTIALPGVGSVVLKKVIISGNNTKARNITVDMLTIEVGLANGFGLPVGAKIVVAHATSGFARNVLPAFVGGQAYAAAANAAVGSVIQNKIGKAALVTIGCDGTGGVTKTNNVEAVSVSPVLSIGTGVTTAFGGLDGSGTIARTTATIENAGLLTVPLVGALVRFTAITVVAEDRFNGSVHTRSTAGTQFAGLKIAGINLPVNVAPNFRVDIPLFGYVIVNEQKIPAAGKKGTMIVNGLKVVIDRLNTLGLPIGTQIVVAHAEATAQR
jgi:hypothetical protein